MLIQPIAGIVAAGLALGASGPTTGEPDLAHAFNTNLALFVGSHPTGSSALGKERVNGGSLTVIGSTVFTRAHPIVASWLGMDSVSATAGGASLAQYSPFTSIGGSFTVACYATVDSLAPPGHVLSVPWRSAGWSDPYQALGCYILASGAMRLSITPSNGTNGQLQGGSVATSGTHLWWWINNGGSITLGIDGTSAHTGSLSGTPYWVGSGNSEPITLFGQSSTSNGQGIDGCLHGLWVWSVAKSVADMQALNSDKTLGLL